MTAKIRQRLLEKTIFIAKNIKMNSICFINEIAILKIVIKYLQITDLKHFNQIRCCALKKKTLQICKG